MNVDAVRHIAYELAKGFYRDYRDPMPAFAFSGGEAHGLALLESALAEPRQTFGRRYLHRTIYDKGAALFRSLVKDHPLFDGNKRLALASLFVFLCGNRVVFYVTKDEAVDFAVRVAMEDVTVREIASWIRRHSVPITGDIESIRRRMMKLSLPALTVKQTLLSEALPREKIVVGALERHLEELGLLERYRKELGLPPLARVSPPYNRSSEPGERQWPSKVKRRRG